MASLLDPFCQVGLSASNHHQASGLMARRMSNLIHRTMGHGVNEFPLIGDMFSLFFDHLNTIINTSEIDTQSK